MRSLGDLRSRVFSAYHEADERAHAEARKRSQAEYEAKERQRQAHEAEVREFLAKLKARDEAALEASRTAENAAAEREDTQRRQAIDRDNRIIDALNKGLALDVDDLPDHLVLDIAQSTPRPEKALTVTGASSGRGAAGS